MAQVVDHRHGLHPEVPDLADQAPDKLLGPGAGPGQLGEAVIPQHAPEFQDYMGVLHGARQPDALGHEGLGGLREDAEVDHAGPYAVRAFQRAGGDAEALLPLFQRLGLDALHQGHEAMYQAGVVPAPDGDALRRHAQGEFLPLRDAGQRRVSGDEAVFLAGGQRKLPGLEAKALPERADGVVVEPGVGPGAEAAVKGEAGHGRSPLFIV